VLSIRDKYTLCMSPVILGSPRSMDVMIRFASKLAEGSVAGLTRRMAPTEPLSVEEFTHLCHVYSELEVSVVAETCEKAQSESELRPPVIRSYFYGFNANSEVAC
jgi:Suv3 C-terminal domain 1